MFPYLWDEMICLARL